MKSFRNRTGKRRGAVAPLAALLMTMLVGMLAFSIDVGYICAVEAELQNAADSAALAGAQQLQTLYISYYSPGQKQQSAYYQTATTNTPGPNGETPPITSAQQFAVYNQAGGVNVEVPVSDISFSYYDGANAPIPAQYPNAFPNTVTVVTRRDNTANTPLGLFFARIFGWNTINLTATASATIYSGDGGGSSGLSLQNVSSNSSTGYVSPHILPVALDVNVWQTFFKTGKSPDGNDYTGPNGSPQLQVYPTTTNTPGSFGLIDVGTPSNNAPAFRNWIDSGQTPNDIQYLLNNNLVPVTPSAPQPWKVGPGLKSTLLTNFQSQMGVSNLIPLFAPASEGASGWGSQGYVAAVGTGQNATYAVVAFVGVTISSASGTGDSNMNISIQPSAIVDPTLTVPFAKPALNPSAYVTSYTGGMQSPSGGAVAATGTGSLSQNSANPTGIQVPSTLGLPPTTFVSAKLTR